MEKFSVKKPFTILVAVIMVLLLGFVSITNLQTNLLPDISTPYLMVVTVYPGASPERHTLKRFQKGGFALLADSRNTVQGRGYLTLASFVAMESDGESVHFVLYIL